jgi:hypothetical protein
MIIDGPQITGSENHRDATVGKTVHQSSSTDHQSRSPVQIYRVFFQLFQ